MSAESLCLDKEEGVVVMEFFAGIGGMRAALERAGDGSGPSPIIVLCR